MKRSFLSFLLFAAVGLAPALAMAVIPPFEAQRISSLVIGDPAAIDAVTLGSGTGGLVQLGNTGFAITDVANCRYIHDNGAGNAVSVYTGFPAILNAVIDGADFGAWDGKQGITGRNAAANPSLFGIAFDYNGNQYWNTWGGINVGADTANNGGLGDLLIRETWAADTSLMGEVGTGDYDAWVLALGKTMPNANGQTGTPAGDFVYDSLLFNSPVSTGAYDAWVLTNGQGNLGGVISYGPIQPAGGPVAAVPEPSSVILLLVALAIIAVSFLLKNQLVSRLFKRFNMKRVAICLLFLGMALGLVVSANAEMVYFLRPVSGSPSDTSEGSYTIGGNGITSPWTVTIANGSANKDISFELYVGTYNSASGASGYQNQGVSLVAAWLKNATTGTLPWAPDPARSSFFTGYSYSWPTANGSQLGGGTNAVSQWGLATWTSTTPPLATAALAPIIGKTLSTAANYPSPENFLTTSSGTTWSSTPFTAVTISGGTTAAGGTTLGLIKIADLSISYGALSQANTTSIQALAAERSVTHANSAIVLNGAVGTLPSSIGYSATQVNGWTSTMIPNMGSVAISVAPPVGGTYYANADLAAISGSATALSTGAAYTDVLTNTNAAHGTDTQAAVDWNVAASAVHGTLTPSTTSGTNLAISGVTGTLNFNYSSSGFFGADTITLTPGGTVNGHTGTVYSNPATQTKNINVTGVTTTNGTDYGPLLTSSTGTDLTGLETKTSNTLQSSASLLTGTLSTAGTISMQWRARTPNETPGVTNLTGAPLVSDVVDLGGAPSTFTLQMSYDPNALPGGSGNEAADASAGIIYLAQNTGTKAAGIWVNAGTGSNLGAYASASHTLGSWGVDIGTHTAWAVVGAVGGGIGEFAVVPEPGTLALLAAGVAALGLAYRRRKTVKA